jgi:hypothetical protein
MIAVAVTIKGDHRIGSIHNAAPAYFITGQSHL